MKFYCPGRHQAATQIGAYFALPETIKRYQNEEIEPLGGEQRSRRVDLQVLAMFPACGSGCGSKLSHTLTHRLNWSKSKEKVLFSRENRTFGAAGRIRTADLILTKDALYLLSYSSKCGDQEGTRTLDLQRDRLAF